MALNASAANRIPSTAPSRPAALPMQQRAVDRAVRGAFPRLADFCFVHVAKPRTLCCVAALHRVPTFARDMRALRAAPRIRRDDLASTVASVVRTRKPALRREIYRDDDPAYGRAAARLEQRLAPTSALVVPVIRDGVVLGALSLCYSHSGRSHGPQHVPLAERLAERVAAALGAASNAASRLRSAARHAGQRRAIRRRLAARD